MSTEPKTLFEKVWQKHVVVEPQGEPTVLYIDLQLLHEVTSPQAFEGLRLAGRKVRRPDRSIATVDHNVPTTIEGRLNIVDQIAATQIATLRKNCADFGIELYDVNSRDRLLGPASSTRSPPPNAPLCARIAPTSASSFTTSIPATKASSTSSALNSALPNPA